MPTMSIVVDVAELGALRDRRARRRRRDAGAGAWSLLAGLAAAASLAAAPPKSMPHLRSAPPRGFAAPADRPCLRGRRPRRPGMHEQRARIAACNCRPGDAAIAGEQRAAAVVAGGVAAVRSLTGRAGLARRSGRPRRRPTPRCRGRSASRRTVAVGDEAEPVGERGAEVPLDRAAPARPVAPAPAGWRWRAPGRPSSSVAGADRDRRAVQPRAAARPPRRRSRRAPAGGRRRRPAGRPRRRRATAPRPAAPARKARVPSIGSTMKTRAAAEPLRAVLALLREPAVVRAGRRAGVACSSRSTARSTSLTGPRPPGFSRTSPWRAGAAEGDLAGRPRRRLEQREVRLPAMTSPSTSRLGTTRPRQGRASFAGRIVAQHRAQVAGDGAFVDRPHDRAVLDPEAAGAARVVAGGRVDRGADQRGDEQARCPSRRAASSRRDRALGQREVAGRRARRRRGAARRRCRCSRSPSWRRGGEIERPARQHAVLDERPARHRQALAVEGPRAADRAAAAGPRRGRCRRAAPARPARP